MNNQQKLKLIKQIENKIQETQNIIKVQEKALTNYQGTLTNLITQLSEIKNQIIKK